MMAIAREFAATNESEKFRENALKKIMPVLEEVSKHKIYKLQQVGS